MSASEPTILGQIVQLQPEQIDASNRLLPLDPAWVDALAAMMKADGQLTPIEVCRLPGRADYTLVTGGHRHAAAAKAGLALRAEVITNDATERRLREASENVNRRNLSPIDRAKAVADLVAVQKAARGLELDQGGQAVAAAARWQQIEKEADDASDIVSLAYGWADEAAERAGLTRRTVYRDLELLRGIPDSVAEALRRADHPVFHNAAQLKALAGLEPVEQSKVLSLLLHADAVVAGAPFDKVTDAIAAMKGRTAPAPDAKRLSAFTGTFGRMPLAEKKAALGELSRVLPKGWSLVEGEPRAAAPAFSAEHERYREETLEAIDQVRELIDGLIEDEALDDERHSVAGVLAAKLQIARLTIAGNGFDLGGGVQ